MPNLHLTLPRTVASPAAARHEATRFAAAHDVLGGAGLALLVLSELVTNAVLHGEEPIQVVISRQADGFRIEVSDGDAQSGTVAPVGARPADLPGGRGLRIVDSLARAWGVELHPDGKTVWAEVGLDRHPDG